MNSKFLANVIVLVVLTMAVKLLEYSGGGYLDLRSDYGLGQLTGGIIVGVFPPLLVAAIPAGIYWAWKKKTMPGIFGVIWVLWVLLGLLPALSEITGGQTG